MNNPNFIIFGERRCGTTTLANWMSCHPDIFLYSKMDNAYFVDSELVGRREWMSGKAAYNKWSEEHSKIEYSSYFKDSENQIAIGEKSADYFFWEPTHCRIKEYLPNVKLVVTLRNPIDRAWSMYWNERGKGRETLSFEEAIDAESNRLNESDYAKLHLSYISRGFYDQSFTKLFKTFNKENVFVFILEEAKQDPKKHLKEIYSFLNVNSALGYDNINKKFNKNWTLIQRPTIKKYYLLSFFETKMFRCISLLAWIIFRNNTLKRRKLITFLAKPFRNTKNSIEMKIETRERLRKIYEPSIKSLEKILNINLAVWLED